MLHIETSKIKAAMECVATGKAEPRYYLKGVLLEITACGDVHLVSTDGERMFFGRIPAAAVQWGDIGGQTSAYKALKNGAKQIILPYDALKEATKQKRFSTCIDQIGEDTYSINGVTCQAIDGKFPLWRNVVRSAFENIHGECPPMEWARVASLESALRIWSGNKTATVRVKGNGNGVGALVTCDDTNAFALVTPQKKDHITPDVLPSFPAELGEVEKV